MCQGGHHPLYCNKVFRTRLQYKTTTKGVLYDYNPSNQYWDRGQQGCNQYKVFVSVEISRTSHYCFLVLLSVAMKYALLKAVKLHPSPLFPGFQASAPPGWLRVCEFPSLVFVLCLPEVDFIAIIVFACSVVSIACSSGWLLHSSSSLKRRVGA